MAVVEQQAAAATYGDIRPKRDDPPTQNLLVDVVDVLSDTISNQQSPIQLKKPAPTTTFLQDNNKRPPLCHPALFRNNPFHARPMPPLQHNPQWTLQYSPWHHHPAQAPFRPSNVSMGSQQQRQLTHNLTFPPSRELTRQSLNDTKYLASSTCESPLFGGRLTPKHEGRDAEGKSLAIAVSESPTNTYRETKAIESPGPGFFSLMNEMDNSADELKINEETCFETQVESVGVFELLPCLDDEKSKTRISPPMMPFLSQSPQLSWEEEEETMKGGDPPGSTTPLNQYGIPDPLADQKNNKQRKRALSLDQKSEDKTVNGPDSLCQPLFQEQALCFQNGMSGNLVLLNLDKDDSRPRSGFDPQRPERNDFRTIMNKRDTNDATSQTAIFSKRRSPEYQRNMPAISQSFTYPVPSPRSMALPPPRSHFTPPRPPHMGSFPPESQISPAFLRQQSRGRCVALNHPVPSKYQGDMEQAMSQPLPDFSSLVNFPNSLRQNRALPSGMRCCVMCGVIRPTCSRTRNRQKSPFQDNYMASSVADDFVTIPTQNKGLCTMCDISVWVVRDTDCQIKWCKGCKNFRQWAFFGDKGLATKCGRCRERQREKYAKMKDIKRRQAEKRQRLMN